jgi:hypothetical protein
MVVHQIDFKRVTVLQPKSDPPVGGDRNAPEALWLTFQGVKPIAWQSKIGWAASPIPVRQHVRYPVDLIGAGTSVPL